MEIAQLIGVGCRALDEERFEDFLAGCTGDFRYRILVWSPEIRKQMVWLDLPLDELRGLFANAARHFRMLDRLQRNVGLVTPRLVGEDRWEADSTFATYATDGKGISRLFAVGRYQDRIVAGAAGPLLQARDVVLQTRDLGVGLHVPL